MPTTNSELAARLEQLQKRAYHGMKLGLERVREALKKAHEPHVGLAFVHVTGSNGKGSTCAMIESIAREAGLRTGLYTSPHLSRFAERIRISGELLSDDVFERALGVALDFTYVDAEGVTSELTFFEVLTVAALVAFREAQVDLAVLEVGLGGRLDATNVIESPLVTAITSIALDHTIELGDTEALIAREKAGILKRGSPLVLGPVSPEADRAIEEVAAAVGAGPIQRVSGAGIDTSRLSLRGPHQADNAAVARAAALILAQRWPAVRSAIDAGLSKARWPGRFERIERGGVLVILDGAHNPHGASALTNALEAEGVLPERTSLVFGALADKDWRSMLGVLAGRASRRFYTSPKGRSPAPLDELVAFAPGIAIESPRQAIEEAIASSSPGDTVVCAGSLYLIGELRAALLGESPDPIIAL